MSEHEEERQAQQPSDHRRTRRDVTDSSDREVMAMFKSIIERLDRMEERLALSVVKETYTTEEVAEKLKRSEWTVRQWCNKGQVNGAKKVHGKGRTGEWRIPHDEVVRLQNDGPLPSRKAS